MMMRGKALIVCLLLALVVALPHAALWSDSLLSKPSAVSCAQNNDDLGWIGLAFMAIMLGAMINAGAQTLSGTFDTPKYKEFLHGQLWSLIECAALLCILATATAGLGEFGRANIDTARAYATIIRNTVWTDFQMVMAANLGASLFTNVNPTIRPGMLSGVYISFQVAPMFRPIYDALGMLMQLLVTAIAQWYAHDFMLCASKNIMLVLLLPAGLFLRAYGLKAGGNALIGVALALYFVYPFLIIQIGQAVSVHSLNEITVPGASSPFGCSDKPICCIGSWPTAAPGEAYIPDGPPGMLNYPSYRLSARKIIENDPVLGGSGCTYNTVMPAIWGALSRSFGSLEFGSIGYGIGAYLLLKLLNLSFVSVTLLYPLIIFVQLTAYHSVYFLFVISVVLPIFVIFITITMAREIAKVLGTEIDLSALEKLI